MVPRDSDPEVHVLIHNGRNFWSAFIALVAVALMSAFVPASAQEEPDTMITVDGGGWGHGVGMSQFGALGRAADGHTHEQILEFYYPGAELTSAEMPTVAVHIHSGAGTVIRPVDAPAGDVADDIEIVDGQGNLIFNSKNGGQLTIRRVTGGFTVVRANGTGGRNLCIDGEGIDRCRVREIRVRFQQGSPTRVSVIDQVSIGTTGNRYQWGELVISRRTPAPQTTLWVVLEGLTMDQYIYGLAEVPASWPTEALKAQAVAGRTYGFDRAISRRASSNWDHPWDLYSTVDDQVYHGFEKETGDYGPVWTSAVDASSDEVMLYNGDPITAFYSSSNGGWTEDSGYVFITSLPYLIAQKDTYDYYQNPFSSWTRDYTGTEVGRWFAESSIGGVGRVLDVGISGHIGESGRVDRATVTLAGTSLTRTMTGSSFRNVINSGVIREGGGLSRQILSTKYTVSVFGGEDPVGGIDRAKRNGNTVSVRGWVFDADSAGSVDVEVRVDGQIVSTLSAGGSRFDIAAVYGEGVSRGFNTQIDVADGAHQLCVYADNVGPGDTFLLGCEVV